MRISDTEPSSVIPSQKKGIQKDENWCSKSAETS